jgi:hypothetical protein
MVLFTRAKNSADQAKEEKLLSDLKAICNGQQIEKDNDYISDPQAAGTNRSLATTMTPTETPLTRSPDTQNEEKPVAAVEGELKKRITPKYGVQVSNELFHNGNVEAWRNIIESYEKKYVGCTVLLYHNGQRIKHISSLFKWGKVKTGDSIFFSVVGEEIKDVAKLKKYLYQGASESFKYFVKKDVNVVLSLF